MSSKCLPCLQGCPYCRDNTPCLVQEDSALRLAVASFQGLCMVLDLACMVVVYHFRRKKVTGSEATFILVKKSLPDKQGLRKFQLLFWVSKYSKSHLTWGSHGVTWRSFPNVSQPKDQHLSWNTSAWMVEQIEDVQLHYGISCVSHLGAHNPVIGT